MKDLTLFRVHLVWFMALTVFGAGPSFLKADDSESTAPTQAQSPPAPTTSSPTDFSLALSRDWWVRFYSGYDFALLDDVIKGTNNYPVFVKQVTGSVVVVITGGGGGPSSTSTVSSSAGNNGIDSGLEIGRKLDDNSALSLTFENVWSQSDNYSVVQSGVTTLSQTVNPDLMSASLNYYRYLFQQKGGRTYVTLGFGYYHAAVGWVDYDTNLVKPNVNAVFTGDTVGGTLGIGQVLAIGDSFGMELSARGRLATFSQVTSPSLTENGTQDTSYGPYTLAITQFLNSNTLQAYAVRNLVPLQGRYAVVDYTGFDSNLSFNFYF